MVRRFSTLACRYVCVCVERPIMPCAAEEECM